MELDNNRNSSGLALINSKKAAEFLDIEENTLAVWRCNKRYPLRYIKVGRLVKYRISDLEAFLEVRTTKH